MGTSWISSVKQRRSLSLYVTAAGIWTDVLREAIADFNRLRVGVTLRTSGDAPTDGGGADVAVSSGDGSIRASYGGATDSGSFDGSTLHGKTLLFSGGGGIEKAFVFLPARPLINTPQGQRAVGSGVMKVIAAHEFVHACGLSNADHSNDDLFMGYPSVDYGSASAQDRVTVSAGGRTIRMPPLVLSRATVSKIGGLWT
jgi:hypothetical protein